MLRTTVRFFVSASKSIPVTPVVGVHNASWESLGRSFTLMYAVLNITGCNFDVYKECQNKLPSILCTVTCHPDEEITEAVARQQCNGTGCCSVTVDSVAGTSQLLFILHRGAKLRGDGSKHPNQSSLWNRITVTASQVMLYWSIVDRQSCASARVNRTSYACVSNHSRCFDSYWSSCQGYFCLCSTGYQGNPYVPGGCSRDKAYNPVQQNPNCTRRCGNISVPFPFGLQDGCSARKQFRLNCTNAANSILQGYGTSRVAYININEGLVGVVDTMRNDQDIDEMEGSDGPVLYVGIEDSDSLQWAVARQTCQEAQKNSSGYACVSIHSICLSVLSESGFVGYRCKCASGFEGNPYIRNGCQDINECNTTPSICGEKVCHNIIGGHNCIECPKGTGYSTRTMQCTLLRKHTLMEGIVIGLSVGFGILLICLSATFLVHRWRTGIQKQVRRKYFRKNHGLVLEQLIALDEHASDNMKIFTLQELEKATNNFDHTRILGRGGHGTVYKGILSDQRVVAIKRSMVIQQKEIKQFINEVAVLSQINHRNIVKLFGCCLETEVPLLVYDFVPNGSLFDILHSGCSSSFSLSWDDYLRIAMEAAGALSYLHSAASISVFHRDVKSSNILLDAKYTAKVSDFGASRLVPIDQTHVVTNVQGTFGYLDPEYYQTRKLNEKSDVYSFGVVLVELLLRREPVFTTESGSKQNLSNFFLLEMKARPIREIVDAQVREEATEEEINKIASLAETCLRLRGEERPTMKQVEMALQFLQIERSDFCHVAPENDQEIQEIERTRAEGAEASWQLLPVNMRSRANLAAQHSRRCYSLEREFMSSAELPR
ncbi:wall-associated receptor kinase 3-like isoform X2 [Phragmites australis]|uniref:wall-associated receptor kinase 3-like isoform X2 n=1 Tax=Phragmites australis TaxID=29695 RepID=UPI002D79B517|nr:wall-associated receptor kinase 3-like isoform X2 [Phragmites australis]